MFRRLYSRLTNRFKDYVRQTVSDAINDVFPADPTVLVDTMEVARRVQLQMDIDPIAERVVDLVKQTDHAIEYETLAECISIDELAKQFDIADLAGEVDHQEIAGALDTSDIASEINLSDLAGELDPEDIAGHIDMDTVAESIDYRKLATALLAAVRQGV
jgi:isopropylmalate/homocitrate/citramalate synthase